MTQSATPARRAGFGLLFAWLIAAAPITSQADPDDDDGWVEGLSISFVDTYGYDYCGDPGLGDRLRKVLWTLSASCDLSQRQRGELREQFELATKQMPLELPEMRKAWESPTADPDDPKRWFYGKFRCKEASYREDKARMESLVDAIEQGTGRPDDILNQRCTK